MVRHHRNPLLARTQKYSLPILAVVIMALALGGLYLVFRSHASNADINGDGIVDIKDLSILAGHFGQVGLTFAQGDINGDGTVNIADLSLLAANWEQTTQPNPIQVSQIPALLGNYSVNFGPSNSPIICTDELTSAYDPQVQAWRQYFVYSGTDHHPYITTRTLPNGQWQTPVDILTPMGGIETGDDGHDCLVIGIDPEGYLHVTGNAHGHPLQMAQSTAPFSLANFINIPMMVDAASETPQVAYPYFFTTTDGTLMLAYATGTPGSTLVWYLNRWDTTGGNPGHWVRVIQLSGSDGQSNFYPVHIAVDRSNTATRGRIHLFGTWRVGLPNDESANPNEDLLDYYSDDDGQTWHQYGSSNPVSMPIQRSQGLRIINTDPSGPGNRFIVNGGGMDVDSQGRPHALVNMSSTAGTDTRRIYHIWYDGSQWHLDPLNSVGNVPRSNVFSDNAGNTWGLLSPTASDKISVINLTPGSPGFESQIIPLAQDLDYGDMNTIFDSNLLHQQNQLSFMFTELGGLDPTTKPDANYQQPAYIETLSVDQLGTIGAGGVAIPHLVSQDTQTDTTDSLSGGTLKKLVTSATVSSPQPLYIKLTATAHVSDSGTTMTLKAVKTTGSGEAAFGQLDFTSTTSVTESTPWLPVQLGGTYTGVLSGAGQISAGSGSGTIDSLKVEVSSLAY